MEGRDKLMESITASESASGGIMRAAQLEKERRARDREARGESSSSGETQETEKNMPGKPLPDLSGSDLDPPSARILQSIYLVEWWIQRNDALMAIHSRNAINGSLVSVIGGGLKERPEIDVGIWGKFSGLQSWRDRSSTGSSTSSHAYNIPATQLSNCVYDKPSQDLHLDMRIFSQIADLELRKVPKDQFQRTLSPILQRKKAEKLAGRRKISATEAVYLLQFPQRRRERKDLMSAGQSSSSLPRASLDNLANSSHERMSFESSIPGSVSLTASEVEKCVRKGGAEIKGHEYWSAASSTFPSSRPSARNLGDLLQKSPSSTRGIAAKYQHHRCRASTSYSLDNSRLSAIKFGSFLNEPLSSKGEPGQKTQCVKLPTSRRAAKMDTSSQTHKTTALEGIGRPLSPAPTRSAPLLERDDRQISRHPQPQATHIDDESRVEKELPSKSRSQERSDDELPTKSPYVKYFPSRNYNISDATQNAARRRAERRSSGANDKPLAGGMVKERKELPRPAYDSSSAGGMTRERKESWKPKFADRSGPQIFAGSLDPDYIRHSEPEISQAAENASRRRTERREFAASDKTLGSGVAREGKEPPQPKSSVRSTGKIDPEYIKHEEPGISDAIKNSRRRRAECCSDSVPFNDRYRNKERKKAWGSVKPQ